MGTALALALSVLTELPSLIGAGINVINLVKGAGATIKKAQDENRDPTPEEWAAINAIIDELRTQLHAP